jgi:hypothetical protein
MRKPVKRLRTGREEASLPDLRVVSERSSQEIQEQVATRALKDALVNLTGNLIRVARGAGRPECIMEHLWTLVTVHVAYADIHGREPDPGLYGEMLQFRHGELPESGDRLEIVFEEQVICRAALQIVASTILEQDRPKQSALRELHRLLRMRDDRLANRKKRSRRLPS